MAGTSFRLSRSDAETCCMHCSQIPFNFFKHILEDFNTRHAQGKSAGFETHPDISPYDLLVYSIKKEYEEAEDKKVFDDKVEEETYKSLAYFDNEHCRPIVNVPNRLKPFVESSNGTTSDELLSPEY